MIDDLDEALRSLLIQDMPISNNEVDIAFDQPTREWTSRLSRPTINLFMHDLRENNKLRTQQPYLGATISGTSAIIGVNPVRLDVHYMVTAWANDPGDEHRLLSRMLMVLYRYKALPEEFQQGQLVGQDYDIMMKVAQYDQRDIRREIWSMLDNEMRPIVDLTVTLAIEPFAEWTVPLVRQTEINFAQINPTGIGFANGNGDFNYSSQTIVNEEPYYSITGMVHSNSELDYLSVRFVEIAAPVTTFPNGRYAASNLRAGSYTLEVVTGQGELSQHRIEVPSDDPEEYNINL